MAARVLQFGRLRLRWSWPVALAVLLAASALLRLGLWQLERAADKIAAQAAYAQAGNDAATPIGELPLAGLPYDQQHQSRRVRLDGAYLDGQHIFLIYQTFEEQLGFEVLSAFRLDADDRIVLVSRGWSPARDAAQLAANLQPLPGPRRVEGQLYIPGEREAARSNPSQNRDWPLIRRHVNLAELGPLFDAPLFPYVVRLAPGEAGLLVRHWPQAAVATDRHFSYALQWFAMAIAVVLTALLLASNLRELLRRRPAPP